MGGLISGANKKGSPEASLCNVPSVLDLTHPKRSATHLLRIIMFIVIIMFVVMLFT